MVTTTHAAELLAAIRADIEQAGGVKMLAHRSGLAEHSIYQRFEGRYAVGPELLHAVLHYTPGNRTLAVLLSWQRDETSGSAPRLSRSSGELQAIVAEDLCDDGLLNREATVAAARELAAEAIALQRTAARGVRQAATGARHRGMSL